MTYNVIYSITLVYGISITLFLRKKKLTLLMKILLVTRKMFRRTFEYVCDTYLTVIKVLESVLVIVTSQ